MHMEVGDNMYGITFKSEDILNRAIEKGLWVIIGNYLVLKRWSKGMAMDEVDFSVIQFNIQVHNLPIEMLTIKNAEVIGNKMGCFIQADREWINEGIGKCFLRIKVRIQVNKPLIDGFWLPIREKERRWIMIKYEKLYELCFAYRRLASFEELWGGY